jgi:uncharacterized protein (UPF0332 family)
MKFDDKYFIEFSFTKEQIAANLQNALKDLNIAKKVDIPDVKFNYAYTSLIKSGLALFSHYQRKIKSIPGHHIKTIDAIAQILKDKAISVMGEAMRSKRNIDMYGGGVSVTEKECREYISFVETVLNRTKRIILL